MKRYAVKFFKDGDLIAIGHGEAKDEDDAYMKADMALHCRSNGMAEYDDYRVEEEEE